ncbi:DUF302 domain-containing protein [Prosthecomicrobium sp. N25]|uniref:DUF302 domain-containing protein n=1 Tax=Prosthecomicrobium sp. N25 TaxID=3129254 RepID=UPI00307828B6
MDYTYARVFGRPFDQVVEATIAALGRHGFGVLSDIDVAATMKRKIGADMRPYRILGACNPGMAHKALQAEPRIGVMLPCNVIVHQTGDDAVEVAAVDPVASMQAIENPALAETAGAVRAALRSAVDEIVV